MSKIEWTDRTWNPIAGCSLVSDGCTNCYAMRMAHRIASTPGGKSYAGLTHSRENNGPVWTGQISFLEDRLFEPAKRLKPTKYFVNSMSDLFHEKLHFEQIAQIFAVMALCPQHTFQVLTKRPQVAVHFFEWLKGAGGLEPYCEAAIRRFPELFLQMQAYPGPGENVHLPTYELLPHLKKEGWRECTKEIEHQAGDGCLLSFSWQYTGPQPFPNIWIGISVENQITANQRIEPLLHIPAAVRFLSCEPLLGPVDLKLKWEDGRSAIDWIIVGGESGPGARPMHPDWVNAIRKECLNGNVPFFFKQWGEFCHESQLQWALCATGDQAKRTFLMAGELGWQHFYKLGKARAGASLYGSTYHEFPQITTNGTTETIHR